MLRRSISRATWGEAVVTTSNEGRTTTFAGLPEAAAQWLPDKIGEAWTASLKQAADAPSSVDLVPVLVPGSTRDLWDYWVDAGQRTVLFWDVLRKRGNQAIEHHKAGQPPVLVFPYDMVIDGRELERPVNYALVRIRPEAGQKLDPTKQPFVVVDPRAGHGPGIGGFKEASEVGVAMRAGHPVYFVTFFPQPEPGQTIEDVGRAEVIFLRKVCELHPDAGKPVVIGNCQAGWAIMMLAAAAPQDVGIVAIAGSPLSYWAGHEGVNPMRYSGGLLGGTWLASLAGDLGNGIFDGAWLVQNFENLNPSNTLWSKQYNLYSKIDTEEERYLGFEKWWSGYFLTTKEEMRFVTNELFVGNKLTKGTIQTSDRRRIDLRNIRCPIVVLASWGDNITPPPQALNWILDLYETDDAIRAHEQVIVYTLDQRIGHLGIFVSGKVAEKQHAEIVNTIDLIGSLPPGLYEMMIDQKQESDIGVDLLPGNYLVRFEGRTVADILALDDGREDERAFETVARISEINEGLYDTLVSPWVRMWTNDITAETLRMMHPLRFERLAISDMNPMLWPLKVAADTVRQHRRPAGPDNPLCATEKAVAQQIETALDHYRDLRDRGQEQAFKAIYNAPLVEALAGLRGAYADARKPPARDEHGERMLEARIEAIKTREEQGGFIEAVIRILLAVAKAERMLDARGLRLAQRIKQAHPALSRISREQVRAAAKEEAFMLRFDEERALAALPQLLPSEAERREAIEIVRKIGAADGVVTPASEAVLAKIERILGLDRAPDAAAPSATSTSQTGKARARRNSAGKAETPAS